MVARVAVVLAWVTCALVPAEPTSAQTPGVPPGDSLPVTGTFAPSGPPATAPRRVDAGNGCVVDVQQEYDVEGSVDGTLEVDFRILVHGPCGSPAGTFDEEWIAVGQLSGVLSGDDVASAFTYTALVRDAGNVTGTIRLGPDLEGEVEVRGRFSDGRLTYTGWIRR